MASSSSTRLADAERAEYERWECKQRAYAFERTEIRRTSRRRFLSCFHVIDIGESYRYFVAKIPGERGIVQLRHCDYCMRKDDRY